MNVVAQGNMVINLNVTAMVAANPKFTVPIKNLSLMNGAVLVVDSNGWTFTLPSVSILIQSLTGSDGALVFRGTFPGGTSILVSDVNMTASSATAPKLAQFDPYNPTWAKLVMLVNFSLVNNASFVMQRSTFNATPSANGGFPMYITGTLTVANRSTFAFISNSWIASSTGSYSYAFYMESSPVTISSSSQWTFTSCSWKKKFFRSCRLLGIYLLLPRWGE